MRGKHGRYRPGQPDEAGDPTADVITEPGPGGVTGASAATASAAGTPAGDAGSTGRTHGAIFVPGGTTFHPPATRYAPTPPSLPPIRTTPLPEYVATTPTDDLPATDLPVTAADDDVHAVVAAVVHAESVPVEAPSVEALPMPSPAAESRPAGSFAGESLPAGQSRADLLAAAAAVRLAAHLPAPSASAVQAPIASAVQAPVVSAVQAPATPAVPASAAPIPPATLPFAPLPAQPAQLAPVAGLTESRHGGDQILPSERSSARGRGGDDTPRGRSRWLFAGLGVLLIAVLVVFLLPSSKKAAVTVQPPTPGVSGRTQTTMLIQLSGNFGGAIASALVAHDSNAKVGTVVLVPSDVIAQVPGFGSMPFGEASTVGDPGAARGALSDLMGVTIDGSWTLTPAALAALVDKLGGVTVQVDRDVTKVVGDTTTIVIAAGSQKLPGSSAVAYASFLAPGETEQARLARFDAVLEQVLAGLPHDQPGLATALASLGAGSVSSFPLAQLATVLSGLAADSTASALTDQLLPVTDFQAGDQQSYTLDTARAANLVSTQFAASVPTSAKATGNRVYVQNQVGTPGLGESTRDKLQKAGFQYVHGENTADMPNAQDPSAVVIFGQTGAKIAEGRAVAAALGLPESDVKISQVGFAAADVVVKLGVDYKQ